MMKINIFLVIMTRVLNVFIHLHTLLYGSLYSIYHLWNQEMSYHLTNLSEIQDLKFKIIAMRPMSKLRVE